MKFWGITDPGCARSQNQDAYQMIELDKNTLLCVVCDGMGGAKSGNVASTLALEVFVQEMKNTWSAEMEEERLDQLLINAAKLANFTVYDQAQQFVEFTGMGTTLVAALVHGKSASILNVGDSRCYSIGESGIRQMTVDHSLVQLMIQRGEILPEQAKTYPGKNLITRAIGTESVANCDIFHRRLEQGECLLLCSDGLSNVIDEQEILFEVIHGQDKQHCCQRLLEIAKNRGAPDNVTCVLIEV